MAALKNPQSLSTEDQKPQKHSTERDLPYQRNFYKMFMDFHKSDYKF